MRNVVMTRSRQSIPAIRDRNADRPIILSRPQAEPNYRGFSHGYEANHLHAPGQLVGNREAIRRRHVLRELGWSPADALGHQITVSIPEFLSTERDWASCRCIRNLDNQR
jgi:hypothetical protein